MKTILYTLVFTLIGSTSILKAQRVGNRTIVKEVNGVSLSFTYEEVKKCDLDKPNIKRLFKITVYLTNRNDETVIFTSKPMGFDPKNRAMGGSPTKCTETLLDRPENDLPYFSTTLRPSAEESIVYYRVTVNVDRIFNIQGTYLPSFNKKV